MAKLSFLAGMAVGYVLGAKAGKQRYEQIKQVSAKAWRSQPVQTQVESAKEVAKTKVAPVAADMVADAARATGEKLRQAKTIPSTIADKADPLDEPGDHGDRESVGETQAG